MGGEVGDPIGEIGEHQKRQNDAEKRERAQVRTEYFHNFRAPPARYRQVLARCRHALSVTVSKGEGEMLPLPSNPLLRVATSAIVSPRRALTDQYPL